MDERTSNNGNRPVLSAVGGAASTDRIAEFGHAVLVLSTPEQKIRRVIGAACEEFHDVLWIDDPHGRAVTTGGPITPYNPESPDHSA